MSPTTNPATGSGGARSHVLDGSHDLENEERADELPEHDDRELKIPSEPAIQALVHEVGRRQEDARAPAR